MIWLAAAAMMMAGQEIDHLPADCAQASNTLEINACATLDVQREQLRLDRYFAAAVARVQGEGDDGAEAAAWLRASQPAWKAYADIACGAVYEHWSGGSIRGVMYLGCMKELTRERTHAIWRDFLTYADSTPPILPEPVGPAAE
ncbi:MAG: DUF1311 domain-containing protein [Brevundimonas sp.]|nr:DUF1311 domain-containing protein [Brevundimonas sp.]